MEDHHRPFQGQGVPGDEIRGHGVIWGGHSKKKYGCSASAIFLAFPSGGCQIGRGGKRIHLIPEYCVPKFEFFGDFLGSEKSFLFFASAEGVVRAVLCHALPDLHSFSIVAQ